jgi:GTP-binding protein
MADHASRWGGVTLAKPEDLHPPRALDPDEIEAGRLLFARECRFVAGAADIEALPSEGLPEVAFIGRSNVGKSSLVNALTGRRMLARTSNTPGRTRQLNFFDLDGRLLLVDLPGYGYAEASKTKIAGWTALSQHYLRRRGSLRRACLLIDSRHGIKDADQPLLRLCDEAALSYQVVLTKADKLRASERDAVATSVLADLKLHTAAHPELHFTSAEHGEGIAALRASLAALASPQPARTGTATAADMVLTRQSR